MSSRKVQINSTLVAKTYDSFDKIKDFSNESVLYLVESQVNFHFGKRPLFISDKELVLIERRKYPQFYAAGWFVSNKPTDDSNKSGSELVVIAHGEDMKSAKEAMIRAAENSDWNNLAANI